MGTNYYLKKKVTEDDKRIINNLLYRDDYDVWDQIRKYCDNQDNEIHLGKNSGGWKFLFDLNDGKYYSDTRASIDEWLSNPEYEIFNEYGEKLSKDKFWNIVLSTMDDDHIDNKEYYTNPKYSKDHPDWTTLERFFGYSRAEGNYGDYYNDGLRFARYTNFS